MLQIKNLTKHFDDKVALNGLSLSIQSGEILCLLGTNGAGKSTTLNLLLNFIEPDGGEIIIDQQKVEPNDKKAVLKARQQMAYIPEQVNLYEQFNAIENVQYLAQLSAINVGENTIKQALTQTGLDSNMWHKPLKDYSKGMRQKVGIAFAIVRKAKVLLLDEPTSGLDHSATVEFIAIVQKLAKQGAAVLMVTHDLNCAEKLATRIEILKQGCIVDAFNNQGLQPGELQQRYEKAIETQANVTPINAAAQYAG